ncbi:thiosulfate oxidation carrier complex protein SoxZ [Salinisphaera sp. P385]|uniref:Thiosulfate oxidation carrier complex protein SoxZ n=1 Tax=Spectribacter acetivorans TaxID=3075603 RepID=A0ABU3B5N0_9GAMM|nr:thiosulfate oxidation carrier complex protein SoxZ [Salinisphaera sp. P385]MDT0617751.1 thiosulfate oxidation carrier complex protein SoxZ [Salinisphaera sp. P385]
MAGRMRIRAQKKGDNTEVKVLMQHPMETGLRKDDQGNPIPAHFITNVTATVGDRTVMESQWGAAVSQNPFLSFRFQGAEKGDKLKIAWKDNQGETAETTTSIR